MKSLSTAAFAAALLLPGSSGLAAGAAPSPGVVGILAPNGTFKPLLAQPVVPQGAQASKLWNGTITATITVFVGAPLPAGTTVHCAISATVVGDSASGLVDTIIESDQVTATGSGSTLTCQNTMPYQWGLFANSSTASLKDSVSLSYSITAINANGDGRLTTSSFAVIGVPSPGATTNFMIAARI